MMNNEQISLQGRTTRSAPLDFDPEVFRALGHDLIDQITHLLASIADRPVAPDTTPSALRKALGDGSLPDTGTDPAVLMQNATELLFENSTFNGHPRYWGYITSSAAPIGVLAELLTAAVNPNVGAWVLSPMASEIEAQTVRWMAELIGYPEGCGGLLVSGGNMANIVAVAAARKAKASPEVGAAGVQSGTRRLRIYASTETHTWLQKTVDLPGLGADDVRWLPTDDHLRIDTTKSDRQ